MTITSQRLNFLRALIVVVAITLFSHGKALAWHSVDLGPDTTHEDITDYVLKHDLHEKEYPDLHKNKKILHDYSNSEKAHILPDKNGERKGPELWAPDPADAEKRAKNLYKNLAFKDTYMETGYRVHLVQDAQVPAHVKKCAHGIDKGKNFFKIDSCEGWANVFKGFDSGKTEWQFQWHGKTWRYWLDDAEDDDNNNDMPDGSEAGYPDKETDGPLIYGESNTWGTYGYGIIPLKQDPKEKPKFPWQGYNPGQPLLPPPPPVDFKTDMVPGNNEGIDEFSWHPNSTIVRQQLGKARVATRDVLQSASKTFPPLIRNWQLSGKTVKGRIMVNRKDGSQITFECLENRTQQVKIDMRIKKTEKDAGIPIRTGTKLVWNNATATLKKGNDLPWGHEFNITWKGETGNKVADGKYDLTIQIMDGDENKLPEKEEGYTPKNKPIPVILDTKPPRIDISGVQDGGRFRKAVLVSYRIKDSFLNPTTVKAVNIPKKETIVFNKGTDKEYTVVTGSRKFYTPGTYRIKVTGEDLAGNPAAESIEFKIEPQRDVNPDDNEDSSSEPILIGPDPDGPDEDAPEAPSPSPPPQGGEGSKPAQIGVLESGFYREMMQLLGSINVPFDLVDPEKGTEEFFRHQILIIPTGGLAGYSNSKFWSGKLELFARNGGKILCYGQWYGRDFEALPGGLKAFGWAQDQSCWFGAAYFDKPHPILSHQKDNEMTIYVDGYFIAWPANAQLIVKKRISQTPLVLTYPFGQGLVVASSLYPDWGKANGQLSQGDRTLFLYTINVKTVLADRVIW